MIRISSTIAILAIASAAAGPLAADESLRVENCTWCHGTSAQGFSTAPRLADSGTSILRIELFSFKEHIRDNPLSSQYMWAAAANLNPGTAR